MGCPVCGSSIVNSNKALDECGFCQSRLLTKNGIPIRLVCDSDVEKFDTARREIAQRLKNDAKNFVIKDGILEKYQGSESVVIIPDCVKVIKDKAFYCNHSIEKIYIPNSVKEIEDARDKYKGAFSECYFLSHIFFQDQSSLEKIGIGTFNYASESVDSVVVENFPFETIKRIGLSAINNKMYQAMLNIAELVKLQKLGLTVLSEGREWTRV